MLYRDRSHPELADARLRFLRQRPEPEDGLARVDGAFVARFATTRGMRMVVAGLLLAAIGFFAMVATFAANVAAGFTGALAIAAGAGLAARGGHEGGWSGWWERLTRRRRS